ncbi:Basic leucine zipper 25 [Zea mays]|uniref:Basic leucine zipper 25 n=1 Tax=Zea mays TaxID=4577 RepID=A0A1D6KFI2_MAIZE|nr:Basic leucine zipper 25 [Zea mays]
MAGGGAGDDDVVVVSCGGRGGGDPGAYAAVLKRKLDLYCAAVAKSMYDQDQSCAIVIVVLCSGEIQMFQLYMGDIDGASLVTNSNVIEDDDFQGKPTNSGTSKELSDDDGDLEENTDPANAKKMRRMVSNRESARRSRKRKQAHLTDLESQVSRLTSENASLLKRLADMTQKYKDASVDNKNLTVDVETMRRKVNIAEEAVRRLTGITLMLPTAFEKPTSSAPLSSCPSDAASASASAAIEDSVKHFLQAPLENSGIIPNAAVFQTKPASLHRVASLENLQKRIVGDAMYSETASTTFSDPEALADR